MSLHKKMLELKERINGPEADQFLNFYYGKFFKGDITIIDGDETWTLSFHYGKCIDVMKGIPNSGVDLGVKGNNEEWASFVNHKSLSIATNKGNKNNLTIMGPPIRFRQNFNVIAQLIRVYAGIR